VHSTEKAPSSVAAETFGNNLGRKTDMPWTNKIPGGQPLKKSFGRYRKGVFGWVNISQRGKTFAQEVSLLYQGPSSSQI